MAGAALLIAQPAARADPWKIVGFAVYGLSVVMLFVSSTLHHGIDGGPTVNEVLRTLDYGSVFLLIAGSVTPLVLVLFRSTYGWTVLGAVWAIAAVGIVLRSVLRQLPEYVTNTLLGYDRPISSPSTVTCSSALFSGQKATSPATFVASGRGVR